MNSYYVYIYLDTRKPGMYVYNDLIFEYEPVYVGKGKKRRFMDHFSIRNKFHSPFYHKLNKIISDGFEPKIVIFKENLSENESFENEIFLINCIGKIVDNTGPLTNLTNGGEGSSGRIMKEETKIKISESHKGIKNGMYGVIHPMKGKTFDEFFGFDKAEVIKRKIRQNANPKNKGKKMNKEFCSKISKSIYKWYEKNEDVKDRISKTLKERFLVKENHPMYGKKQSEYTKKKISEKLAEFYKKNPHEKLSEEVKEKMSNSSKGNKNSSFTIYKIRNIETLEILTFNGSNELKEFINLFKKEKGLAKTKPPSISLIKNGKNNEYFELVEKYYPNRKN